MKPTTYILEIYSSFSMDVEKTFESQNPFMNINIGDIINPGTWENSDFPKERKILKVAKLEHFIWDFGKKTTHKIGVYTVPVEDNRASREH
jgi:hypothetical protein